MTTLYQHLLDTDARLATHGVPTLSPWWRDEACLFYGHPAAQEWLACVGRGGAKSHALAKTAIVETMFGEHRIPPGERHYFAIVSENVTEASKTATIVASYLRMLGVRVAPSGDAIDLVDDPSRGIRVLAARIGGVSGFRVFGWGADECAKWRDSDSGANPAAEVISSIRAMTITHPRARGRMFSSPFGKVGVFYETFARGSTLNTHVSHAPTWTANPSVTEQQTRDLEPDERVWRREYKAEPQASALAAFDHAAVVRAFEARPLLEQCPRVMVTDVSSGRKDGFVWCTAGWCLDPQSRRGHLLLTDIDGIEGSFWRAIKSADVIARIVRRAKELGITQVHGDQREAYAITSAIEAHGLSYTVHDWTASTKTRAVERLRRLLADGELAITPHDKMQRQLTDYEEIVTASGGLRYAGRGGGHDDYAALALTAMMADLDGQIATRLQGDGPSAWTRDRSQYRYSDMGDYGHGRGRSRY